MEITIENRPNNAYLKVLLSENESIKAESGSMMTMTLNIDVLAQGAEGSSEEEAANLKDFISRSALARSLFIASGGDAEITFAPPLPCDIVEFDLKGNHIYIDGACFLAASSALNFATQGSLESVMKGTGLYLQKVSGMGKLYLKSFGDVIEKKLDHEESIIIDTGHLLAYEQTVAHKLLRTKGGARTHGEWLVARFTGPGKVYLQSRNLSEFTKTLIRYMPFDF